MVVVGDYDLDGLLGTALLVKYLSKDVKDLEYFVAPRSWGYDISKKLSHENLKDKDIIIVDNGIQLINSLDNRIKIIFDHHIINSDSSIEKIDGYIGSTYIKYDRTKTSSELVLDYLLEKGYPVTDLEKELVLLTRYSDGLDTDYDNSKFKNLIKNPFITSVLGPQTNLLFSFVPVVNSWGRIQTEPNSSSVILCLINLDNKNCVEYLKKLKEMNSIRKAMQDTLTKHIASDLDNFVYGDFIVVAPGIVSPGLSSAVAGRIKSITNLNVAIVYECDKDLKASFRTCDSVCSMDNVKKVVKGAELGGHKYAFGGSIYDFDLFLKSIASNSFGKEKVLEAGNMSNWEKLTTNVIYRIDWSGLEYSRSTNSFNIWSANNLKIIDFFNSSRGYPKYVRKQFRSLYTCAVY